MTRPEPCSSMRLPRGYAALRLDLGAALRARRRERRAKQQTVADAAGVARETLSRIEAGRAYPRPDTLDRLMLELDLDWDDVAVRGEPAGRPRIFHDSGRGERCHRLGRALRAGRERIGLSLSEAGARSGLSASQLSRFERGEVLASRVLVDAVEDANLPAEDRSPMLSHPFLEHLRTIGAEEL